MEESLCTFTLCNLCNFCNKTFVSKVVLINHQKTAKYCLKKQGKNNNEYKCEYCDKILATQLRLNTHINICKLKDKKVNKYISLSEEKDEEIKKYISLSKEKEKEVKKYISLSKEKEKELKKYINESLSKDKIIEELRNLLEKSNNTIAEIAKQPKMISNNDNRIRTQTNNQSFDINDFKKISNVLEHHLTPDVLSNGQKGLADMLKKHLLQNEKGELIYECTDVSRQKFEFINKHGYIESDPKAAKLLTSLNSANIFDVAHSTGKKLWEKDDGVNHDSQTVHMPKVTEVLDIKEDSSKFRSHLASITTR
jgi:hypothetical protein